MTEKAAVRTNPAVTPGRNQDDELAHPNIPLNFEGLGHVKRMNIYPKQQDLHY